MLKVYDTWLMDYKPTRLEKFLPCQSYANYYVLRQTLTILYLESNKIDAEGARHLAHALQTNVVREVFFFVNDVRTMTFQYRHSQR
jgi:hypothetical protein